MKLLIFPRYSNLQASTRVRFSQFVPVLEHAGFNADIYPIISNATVGGLTGGNVNWITLLASRVRSFYRVATKLNKSETQTLVHVYTEFFPWLPYWLEKLLFKLSGHKHFSVELDDAWFHRYDNHRIGLVRWLLGKKIDKVMRDASCVIAGNAYIADRARAAGAQRVEIVPTVVDTDKYAAAKPNFEVSQNSKRDKLPVIGWIGSPSTTQFLWVVESAIRELHERKMATFVAFGADARQLTGLPVTVIPWDEAAEISTLYRFDIGIMPLTDSMFERGKCGYKLIQYMACGLPVVASPVGVNSTIVLNHESGYLASTADEWVTYLTLLCQDAALRDKLGKVGLQRATDHYSLKMAAPKVVSIFQSLVANQ
jgi:glycosyltransferase involved in cell wall biosynthesis